MVDKTKFNIKTIDSGTLRRRLLSSVPVLLVAAGLIFANSNLVKEVELAGLSLTELFNAAFAFMLALAVVAELTRFSPIAERDRYIILGLTFVAVFLTIAAAILFGSNIWLLTLVTSGALAAACAVVVGALRLLKYPVPPLVVVTAFLVVGSVAHFFGFSYFDDSLSWVVILLLGTFTSDTSAFLVGSLIGRNKLIPSISPNKTWEGFFASLICTALVVWLLGTILLPVQIEFVPAFLVGAALAVSSTVGDLAQSKLKRLFKVKDSGNILPGHGGVFDRVDALLLNMVVVFWLAIWIS